MSFTETLVILVVAMIVLGPKKLPQAARPVDPGRFIERRVDRRHRRQIYDGRIADRLPDRRKGQNAAPVLRLAVPLDGILSENGDELIQDPAVGRQKQVRDPRNHHPGNEVREIRYGLHRLFEPVVFEITEKDRQQNRTQESEDKFQNRQNDRISRQHPKAGAGRGEHIVKVFEPGHSRPFAAKNPVIDGKIFKSQDDAGHRQIRKQKQKHDRGDHHQIQAVIFPNGTHFGASPNFFEQPAHDPVNNAARHQRPGDAKPQNQPHIRARHKIDKADKTLDILFYGDRIPVFLDVGNVHRSGQRKDADRAFVDQFDIFAAIDADRSVKMKSDGFQAGKIDYIIAEKNGILFLRVCARLYR